MLGTQTRKKKMRKLFDKLHAQIACASEAFHRDDPKVSQEFLLLHSAL